MRHAKYWHFNTILIITTEEEDISVLVQFVYVFKASICLQETHLIIGEQKKFSYYSVGHANANFSVFIYRIRNQFLKKRIMI